MEGKSAERAGGRKRDRQVRSSRLGRRTAGEWVRTRAGNFRWSWNCNSEVRALRGGPGTGGCDVDAGQDPELAAGGRHLLCKDSRAERERSGAREPGAGFW